METEQAIAIANAWWANHPDGPGCNCMCETPAEHAEGQAIQDRMRKQFRIPKDLCVGCYLGDDGPSIHDYGYGCEYSS